MVQSLMALALRRVLAWLVWRDDHAKDLEIVVLRHQLRMLRRPVGRPRFRWSDRLFLAAASRHLARETVLAGTASSSDGSGPTAQPRPGHRPPVHGELVAQGEVLESELAMAAAEERAESKQVEQRADHGGQCRRIRAERSTCGPPDGVLAKDTRKSALVTGTTPTGVSAVGSMGIPPVAAAHGGPRLSALVGKARR
jgi:hypothetical protein